MSGPVDEWLQRHQAGSAQGCTDITGEFLEDLRNDLDRVAREVVAQVPERQRPLRAPKSRVASVLRCERNTLASLGATVTTNEAMVRGLLVDRLAALQVRGALTAPAGAAVRAHLLADPDPSIEEVLERHALLDALDEPARSVQQHLGAIGREWWPRTQVPVTLALADAQVLVSARFDLELGGPGTDHPPLIVEVKSGAEHDDHRHDLYLYALLAALRRGTPPPAGLAVWYLDGGFPFIDLTISVLETAARRLSDALERLGRLAAGDAPTESPGRWCGWCPALEHCPSARTEPTGGDDDPWNDWEYNDVR